MVSKEEEEVVYVIFLKIEHVRKNSPLRPLSVVCSRLADALIGVCSEEVPLCLRQVGGKASAAVLVEVAKRG